MLVVWFAARAFRLPFFIVAFSWLSARAHAGAKLEMTPSMGQGKTGISFRSAEHLEAAGVTWLEVWA